MTPNLDNIRKTGLYSTTQVEKILGVNRSTIGRWLQRGVIRCGYHRHNKRRFFEGAEIIRFFNARLA